MNATLTAVRGTLSAAQIEREKEMKERGQARAKAQLERALQRDPSETRSGYAMTKRAIKPTADAIEAWLNEAISGKAGRLNAVASYLLGVDAELAAFITLKALLHNGIRGYTLKSCAGNIARALEAEYTADAFKSENEPLYNSIMKTAKGRGLTGERAANAVMKGARFFNVQRLQWTNKQRLQIGTKLIELAIAATGMFSVEEIKAARVTTYRIRLTSQVESWFKEFNEAGTVTTPLYLPMVQQPKPWTSIEGGGYYTEELGGTQLILKPHDGQLEALKAGDIQTVLNAVNALQNTSWRVNERVLEVMRQAWDMDAGLTCLPQRTDTPIPELPQEVHEAGENSPERKAWRRKVRAIKDANAKELGARLEFSRTIEIASQSAGYNAIYFPYRLDFRGRIYATGTSLNPQGQDYSKALLTFSEGKALGERGLFWLGVHGSNLFGFDKVSFEDRYEWAITNREKAIAVAENPLNNLWWTEADSPWSFLAWCFEWAEANEAFISHLPVALDGSCNGIQHFSAMLRDEIGGAGVNLVPSNKPQDIYARVADRVVEILKKGLENNVPQPTHNLDVCLPTLNGTERNGKTSAGIDNRANDGTESESKAADKVVGSIRELMNNDDKESVTVKRGRGRPKKADKDKKPAKVNKKDIDYSFIDQSWVQFGINRSITKRAVMVLPYGGTFSSCLEYVREAVTDKIKGGAINPFGKDELLLSQAVKRLASIVWQAIGDIVIGARDVMSFLQGCARVYTKATNKPLQWATPTGFIIHQAYFDYDKDRVETTFNGKRLSFQGVAKDNKLNGSKQASSVSPNFVHSLDASALMLTVARCNREGVSSLAMIHDSYGTHAADTDTLALLLREEFVSMYANHDVLAEFRDHLASLMSPEEAAEMPELPPRGTLDLNTILSSRYFFA